MLNKILIGLIVVVVALIGFVVFDNFVMPNAVPIAKVSQLKGAATVKRSDGGDSLMNESLLYAADQVTVVNGNMTLQFADGTYIKLGNKTRLELDRYDYDQETNTVSATLKFVRGALRAVTGKVNMARNIRIVDQQGTTIGIRGTDIFVGNIEYDKLDVLLIESGKPVTVNNRLGNQTLAAGQGTTITADAAPTAAKFWPQKKVDAALALVK